MPRAFILVMDSFGIGGAPDAANFGDEGSDTFGHIAAACSAGRADLDGVRSGPLIIPNLLRLGLGAASELSTGIWPDGVDRVDPAGCVYGAAQERSLGKDTPSGHWEMAGLPVDYDWGYFPKTEPCFPEALTNALIAEAGLPGLLGNKHASGTVIINELGDEHVRSGMPIAYTSADSVLQIAAHEDIFGLERLYELCAIARRLVDDYQIGRVIARPFVGSDGQYTRTANRKDLATPPHGPTLLDQVLNDGGHVFSIGKIGDIFAHVSTGTEIKADGNDALMAATIDAARSAPDRALVLTNFVDFDTLYGHRRDVAGYAAAVEAFDRMLPEFEAVMKPGDLAVITADHGCDPTWPGSDHTRENVPVLMFGSYTEDWSNDVYDGFTVIADRLSAALQLG